MRAVFALAETETEEAPMMSTKEVATEFGVCPKTVTRWAKAGKLRATLTLGGHRRYRREEIETLLEERR